MENAIPVSTRVALEPQYHQQDDLKHELPLEDSSNNFTVKCDAEITLSNGSYKAEPERHFFKYVLRWTSAKSGSIIEAELHSDASRNENQASVTSLVNRKISCFVKCDNKMILSGGSLYKEEP